LNAYLAQAVLFGVAAWKIFHYDKVNEYG